MLGLLQPTPLSLFYTPRPPKQRKSRNMSWPFLTHCHVQQSSLVLSSTPPVVSLLFASLPKQRKLFFEPKCSGHVFKNNMQTKTTTKWHKISQVSKCFVDFALFFLNVVITTSVWYHVFLPPTPHPALKFAMYTPSRLRTWFNGLLNVFRYFLKARSNFYLDSEIL